MKNFEYYVPTAAASAAALAADGEAAALKAGGTDLVPMLKEGLASPRRVVTLLGVEGLAGIEVGSDSCRIGATTTIAAVAAHAALAGTAVGDAAGSTATPLIRNRATVGGNLCQRPRCWYFRHRDYRCSKKGGDTCYTMEGENKYHAIFENTTCNIVHPSNLAPALWAHDATVHVHPPKGEARAIPIDRFWVTPEEDISTEVVLEPGEVMVGVSFPKPGPRSGSSYVEVREKQSYDWALVSCAARVDLDEAGKVSDLRVVISAVAPTPLRREGAERVLRGRAFTEELAWKAGEAAAADATPLRDNGYKVRMLRACVAHALINARQRAKEA